MAATLPLLTTGAWSIRLSCIFCSERADSVSVT